MPTAFREIPRGYSIDAFAKLAANETRTDGWHPGAALQGAVTLGAVPTRLPLLVEDAAGASKAGLVMATLYSAP